MASGFFLGGAADGLRAGEQTAIQQQAETRNQHTQAFAEVDKQITSTLENINAIFKAQAEHGQTPDPNNPAITSLIKSIEPLAAKIGRDPRQISLLVGTMAQRPAAEDDKQHSVVQIGEDGNGLTTTKKYGLLEKKSGAITPIGANGKPIAQLDDTEVITPRQAQVANPPAPPAVVSPPVTAPVSPISAPATADATPVVPASFNARFSPAITPAAQTEPAPAPTPTGPTLPPNLPPGKEAIDYSVQNNITGDEFLKAIPPSGRGIVKDIAEYRIDPKSLSVRGGHREQILGLASQYSGHTYDQKYYNSMSKALNEFMAGGNTSPAGQITAGNVAIMHLGNVANGVDKMEAIPGLLAKIAASGTPLVSYAANALKNRAILGTSEGQALQAFLTARNRYAEEITKFYSGSQGSEAERKRSIDTLDAALSVGELYSTLNSEGELLNGKVNVLQDRWKTSQAGPRFFDIAVKRAIPDFPVLQDKSAEALDRISQGYMTAKARAKSGAAPAGGTVVDFRSYFGNK